MTVGSKLGYAYQWKPISTMKGQMVKKTLVMMLCTATVCLYGVTFQELSERMQEGGGNVCRIDGTDEGAKGRVDRRGME